MGNCYSGFQYFCDLRSDIFRLILPLDNFPHIAGAYLDEARSSENDQMVIKDKKQIPLSTEFKRRACCRLEAH